MDYLTIEKFDSLPFGKKIEYLYEAWKKPYTSSRVSLNEGKRIIGESCDYLLNRMGERMDECADDYMFDFQLLDREDFNARFNGGEGVCTKDLEIYLNESLLRDPEVFGGSTLFHERITKRIKLGVGQLVPILEECLAHRALFIAFGAYEEIRPTEVYDTMKEVFGESLDGMFLSYVGGEKFQKVFRFITSQDERQTEKKVIPAYVR